MSGCVLDWFSRPDAEAHGSAKQMHGSTNVLPLRLLQNIIETQKLKQSLTFGLRSSNWEWNLMSVCLCKNVLGTCGHIKMSIFAAEGEHFLLVSVCHAEFTQLSPVYECSHLQEDPYMQFKYINDQINTGVLPVEEVPITELLLCGACRNIVVQVNKLREEMFYNLCSHHCREFSREAGVSPHVSQ